MWASFVIFFLVSNLTNFLNAYFKAQTGDYTILTKIKENQLKQLQSRSEFLKNSGTYRLLNSDQKIWISINWNEVKGTGNTNMPFSSVIVFLRIKYEKSNLNNWILNLQKSISKLIFAGYTGSKKSNRINIRT